jgi:hypothetical protein
MKDERDTINRRIKWITKQIFEDYMENTLYDYRYNEIVNVDNLHVVKRKLFNEFLDKPNHIFDDLNVLKVLFEFYIDT